MLTGVVLLFSSVSADQPLLYCAALGITGLSLWCCLCGYLVQTRYPFGTRSAEITHGVIAVFAGLFTIISVGSSVFLFFRPDPPEYKHSEVDLGVFFLQVLCLS